jgi:Ca2+-binding RTX toxin-like protein
MKQAGEAGLAPIGGAAAPFLGIPTMPGTSLRAGDLAVIGYSTSMSDGTGNPALVDSISIVLLHDLAAGSSFFLTDRSWNGTAFSNSGTDGTYTYTAAGAMSAGTVITLTQADFAGAGVDFDFIAGEAVYIYQGTNANTPTSFITALEAGDNNNTFGASLANTGLSTAAGTAVALQYDVAAYAGPSTYASSFMYNGAGVTLQKSIADPTNWVGDDQDGVNAVEQRVQTSPWLVAADMDMWGATAGGGGGLVNISADHTFGSGIDDFNTSILYNGLLNAGNPVFWHMTDLEFDTVDGKFFLVDSDITGGHNRILQGNIADLLANPGSQPNLTVLYSDVGVTTASRLDNLTVDTVNNIVYFTHGDNLEKVQYNTSLQTPTILFDANIVGNPAGSSNNFYNDMVIDFATGHIYLSSTRVLAGASGDAVSKNFIYDLSGLTAGSGAGAFTFAAGNTGTARLLVFADNDITYNPFPGTNTGTSPFSSTADPYAWAIERGTLDGLAIDTVNHILYFSTGEILYDHDGSSGTAPIYSGGVVASYALTGNPTGLATILFQQPAQNSGAVYGLMGDLEIDTATGRYYVTDYNGTSASNTDQNIWTGALAAPGTPTQFSSDVFNVNGLSTIGMTINHAPTLTGTGLTPSVTEASSAPSSGETSKVAVFSGVTIDDIDTGPGDEITGAVVRISNNFESGATHQDLLRINNLTSGTIAGSGIAFTYDQTSGAMVLTGAATIAEYKAAIELVTFSTSGDDVTAFGTAGTRQVAVSVSDGLSMSDEVFATVTVTGINDAPVNAGLTGSYNTTEDIASLALTGVSVSDVDADPATQNVVVTLSVAHGTLTILTNVANGITAGQITAGVNNSATITLTATQSQINATLAAASGLLYVPIADYNGTDGLTVVTNDQGFNGNDPGLTGTGTSEQDSDTKTINISAVVDIANDSLSFAEDSGTHTLTMPNNDTFENANRAITSVTQGAHGTVTINDNGTAGTNLDDFIVYTQDPDYNGTDSFTYTVTSGGVTETATVNVTITPVVDIANDSPTTNEDTAVNVMVLANDSFEGATATITNIGAAAHGTAVLNDNGTPGLTTDDYIVYTPNADYNGADSFTYTVTSGGVTETATVNVTVNAVADIVTDSVSVAEDSGANTLDLLGNDSFESAARFISAVTQGAHGSVAINNAGTPGNTADDFVVYTVTAANFVGADTFNYTVTSGGVTETTSVNVTITAVNDGPLNTVPGTQTINEDATLTFTGGTLISVNDIDVGGGSLTVTLSVLTGQLTLSGVAGLAFTTGSGTDDSTMTFSGTQAAVNAALNGLLYEPTQDNNGSDTLTITTNDNGNTGTPGALEDMDTVTINITPVADIAADSASVGEDSGANALNLLGNDNFENAGRAITSVTQGAHGTVTIDDNGTPGNAADDFAVYTPDADYNGADSFTYTVTSGGVTETATVSMTVTAAADIADDSATTNEDTAANVMVLGNDTFEATPAITAVGAAAHGTAVLNDNGTPGNTADDYIVYTPNADYNGADSFTYTVTSGGVTEMATVNMTVTAVADIVDDAVSVVQDSGSNSLALLANDSFESAARAITAVGAAAHGTTAINNAGTPGNTADDFVTYTPTAGYSGPDSFTYTVTSGGVMETANVTVDVTAPNTAPAVDLDADDSSGATLGDFASSYTEGGAAAAIADTDVSITDADAGDNITGATISLSDPEGGDQLNVVGALPGSIVASGGGTDTITLSGTGTRAEYQQALTQIFFSSTSDNPTALGTHNDRSIGIIVNDGTANSAPVTATVSVVGVDDAPVAKNDAVATDEATLLAGNVFANNGSGADSDVDGPPLSVSAVNGNAGVVGTQVTLASGAKLTVNANGTFNYDPNHAFDATPAAGSGASNMPAHDSFTYTLTGGGTGTVTVTIAGLDSDDILLGTSGDDILKGGIGIDSMSGGAGNDAYFVDNAADSVTEAAGQGNDRVFASVSYTLGAGVQVELMTTDNHAGTAAINLTGNELANAIYGNAGDNILMGGGGNDGLVGNGGNDVLNGGAGVDSTNGGAGDDFHFVDNAGDVVIEAAGEGNDRVFASVSYVLGASAEVELLTTDNSAGTAAIDLTGNAGVQGIFGNAGANRLTGGGGADSLVGLQGDDWYFITDGHEQVTEAVGEGNDRVFASVSYALTPGAEIETLSTDFNGGTAAINLTGNEFGNLIYGNEGINILSGGNGNDTLFGLGGNDILIGGVGMDTTYGGAGDDFHFVDNAGDVVIEAVGQGAHDRVFASVSYTLTAGAEVELLTTDWHAGTDAINLTGNELTNLIYGNEGDNILNGGAGNDALIGNGGADTFAFTTALAANNVDTIVDFTAGTDKIALDDAVFTAIGGLGALNPNAFFAGAAAHDADDRIIYNQGTGQLFYDADGNGAGAAILFATIGNHAALTATDFAVI